MIQKIGKKIYEEHSEIVYALSHNSRACQKPRATKIIKKDEIDEWEQKLVNGNKRQIMTFPEDSSVPVHVVCPNDEYPYPGFVTNGNSYTKEKYPVLLCCFKRDHSSKNKMIKI